MGDIKKRIDCRIDEHCFQMETETEETPKNIFFSDSKREKNIFQIDTNKKMYNVHKIRIDGSPTLSRITKLSKKVWSDAAFASRQSYFLRNGTIRNKNGKNIKLPYNLAKYYPDFTKKFLNYIKSTHGDLKPELITELHQKLFIDHKMKISNGLRSLLKNFQKQKYLYHFLKNTESYRNLKCIYSQLPIQTLRYVSSAWKSYYEGLKEWKIHPERFMGKPNIPRVRKIEPQYLISISGHFLNNEKYAKGIVEHYKRTLRTKKKYNKKGKLIRTATTGELRLPPKFLKNFPENDPFPTIRTKIPIEKIIEIRIVPKGNHYDFEIIYPKPIKKNSRVNSKRALSIDIGVNISASLTTNFGTHPLLLRGSQIKSHNQYFNKRIKFLQSVRFRLDDDLRKRMKSDKSITVRDLTPTEIKKILIRYIAHERKKVVSRIQKRREKQIKKGNHHLNPASPYDREIIGYLNSIKKFTKTNQLIKVKNRVVSFIEHEIARLSKNRKRFLLSVFHKISSDIIEYCLHHHIGNIAVGYNVGWKQGAKFGRKNTQNFQHIPFNCLLQFLEYKSRLVGIRFKSISESHTSQCSALDFESIEHHDKYMGKRKPSIKGRKSKKEISKGGSRFKRDYPRGLYRSADGYIIHSDVNGSFNIGRVAYPNLFNRRTLTVENMLLNPIGVKIKI